MSLSLYDSRRRAVVPFASIEPGRVRMYNCGPTVYSTAHVGNFRSFLLADLLRRHLEWSGYDVLQVMNITDVGHLTEDDRADGDGEDKLLAAARQHGWDPFQVARHFEDAFHVDRRRLGFLDAHHYPRATEHIPEMVEMIRTLLDRGHAYEAGGEVYFDVSSFPAYGALSGRRLDEQRPGARVEVHPHKRSPEDFALWKRDAAHLMQFDPGNPDLARGFPGWHIECSAMARRYLGETFDVHTGGEDNLFPHHECEIAQSTAATGEPLSRWWLHTKHLLVDGKKMSKRAGTAYTLDDLVGKGFEPAVVRFALLSHHYRRPMNLTDEALRAARTTVRRLQTTHDELRAKAEDSVPSHLDSAQRLLAEFGAALDDDLDMPRALVSVFAAVSEWNRSELLPSESAAALAALRRVDDVLGVIERQARPLKLDLEELEAYPEMPLKAALTSLERGEPGPALAARHRARISRDWSTADRVREALADLGFEVRDTAEGVAWRVGSGR